MSAPEAAPALAAPAEESKVSQNPAPVPEVVPSAPEVPKAQEATPETDKHAQEPIQATDEIVKAGEDSLVPAPDIPAEPAATAAAAEPAKEETKPVDIEADVHKKEERPKSPSLLAKLLAPFKNDKLKAEKKAKVPKSPKKEKKKDESAAEAAPAADEVNKEEASTQVQAPAAEPVNVEGSNEATRATEVEAAESPAEVAVPAPVEEKREDKAAKAKRRISLGAFFKHKPKTEVVTPAKVDEHPPKIDEPAPVAPLEDPVSQTTEPATQAVTNTSVSNKEPVQPVDVAPVAAPVVAAAA